MPQCRLLISNKLGLHARAAAKLVGVAGRYACTIQLQHGARTANAKSIMGVMMLAASHGTWLDVTAEGDDAEQALAALADLLARRFDEPE